MRAMIQTDPFGNKGKTGTYNPVSCNPLFQASFFLVHPLFFGCPLIMKRSAAGALRNFL